MRILEAITKQWALRWWILLGLGSVGATLCLRALIFILETVSLNPNFPGSQTVAERLFSLSVWIDLLFVLVWGMAGALAVVCLAMVCVVRREFRALSGRFALVWAISIAVTLGVAQIPGFAFVDARLPGLVRVMESSQPLVAAIEQYRKDHGEFPRSLELLIPDYLSEIPKTGVPVRQEFSYMVGRKPHSDVIGCEADYELTVYLPMEFIAQSSPDEWRRCPGPVRMVNATEEPLTRVGDWVILPGNN